MTLWMLWTIAVSIPLTVAAGAADSLLSRRHRPTRGVWSAALVVIAGLAVWSALRIPGPVGLSSSPSAAATAAGAARPGLVERGLAWMVPVAGQVDAWVPYLWAALSTALAGAFLVGLTLLRRRLRSWRRVSLDGEEVVLSPAYGPALVGILRPTIVMPTWILSLTPRERALALRHEVEHRSARDTLLLSAGALSVALMPWNPGVWAMNRRLRQAIEVDCDRRVLRAGWPPVEYGSLLIELSAAAPRAGLGVVGLTESTNLLERRLTMMMRRTKRPGAAWMAAAVALSGAAMVAACENPPPSMVEPEAEAAVSTMQRLEAEPPTEVRFGPGTGEGAPLVYVDGVRVEGDLSDLRPDAIERIEVVKGEAATAFFGEDADRGVVQIFLKEGAEDQLWAPRTEGEDGAGAEVGGVMVRRAAPAPRR